jgi:hypothetical protein
MPRFNCANCGWASEYTGELDEHQTTCPRCSSALSLQVERFNTPFTNLTNAEDLDSGDPYLWDQEIADADDEEADGHGDGGDSNPARR